MNIYFGFYRPGGWTAVICLFLFFPFLLFSQRTVSKKDSLLRGLPTLTNPRDRVNALDQLARTYRLYQQWDSTRIFAQQALNLAEEIGWPEGQVMPLRTLSLHARTAEADMPAASAFLHRALAIARTQRAANLVAPTMLDIAGLYKISGPVDSAFYYFTEAEKMMAGTALEDQRWKVLRGIGDLYLREQAFDKAESYLTRALQLAEQAGDRTGYGFVLFYLAELYLITEQFEQYAGVTRKWAEYQASRNEPVKLLPDTRHVGLINNFTADHQARIERLEALLPRFLAEEQPKVDYAFACEDYGQLLIDRGETEKGLQYLQWAADFYRAHPGMTNFERGVYSKLYRAHRAAGRSGPALHYLEQYLTIADSLQSAAVRENLHELEVRYETEKKEQALAMQGLQLERQRTQRNLFLATSLLLSLLAVSLIFGFRTRIKANRRIAAQEKELQAQQIRQLQQEKRLLSVQAIVEGQEKERLRLAKDLHDGLGGLLGAVKTNFGSLSVAKTTGKEEQVLQYAHRLLDEACVEVRRISHNMMPRALTLSGLRSALEDLTGQLKKQGLGAELEIVGLREEPLPSQSLHVYRIIQELTNNVVKHARAAEVLIQLIEHENTLSILVEDDGRGFDPVKAQQRGGLGLSSIAARVEYMQGVINWDSVPGQGVTVNIRMPLHRQSGALSA